MTHRDRLKWLARGMMIAAIILALGALVITPRPGWAQGGEEELRRGVEGAGEPSTELESDSPGGGGLLPPAQSDDLSMAQEIERARRARPMQQDSPLGAQGEPEAQAYGSPLVVPAAEFAYSGLGSTYRFELTQGYVRGGPGCGMAPLYLPNRTRVTEVWASLYDNDPAADRDAWAYVYRLSHFTGVTQLMAFISSAGYSPSGGIIAPADTVIDYAKVDHLNYAYYAYGCVQSANTRIYSLRVFYVPE
jgi:hypothetical protein